ncbi:DegT/DnrJ/EryC1/StrS family aminotransferase [Paenibacillus koleovorans]|uniref:DegT/DnrJ/EryC1/StrS family aminotransferase n=1 Tax=Paenibacillus koleovorans TaxID=121608 RepID=UPI000FD8DD35|nr:DegT/DnrJ/EryC1/StrS family aminotransferase [Paenibacillus koleovorans]
MQKLDKLAIHGGTPVRHTMNAGMLRGAMVVGPEETERVAQVMRAQSMSRYYGPDNQGAVSTFEDRLGAGLGMPYTLGVSSGTAALVVALKALGIGYGDKVIVPANTFTATPGAVICCNAVPVYCDMDETLNMDPEDLERVMDDEVKAIIVVHINGHPCDMDRISAFAAKYNLPIIEDVAQAFGASYKGQQAGTFGTINAFSFQMQKIITAGEGGAVATRDFNLFERSVRYHDQGSFRDKDRYVTPGSGLTAGEAVIGQNYRMTEMAGAIMLEQWEKRDLIISSMRRNHRKIKQALKAELPGIQFRKTVDEDGDIGCILALLHDSAERAKQFVEAMTAENFFTYFMYGAKPIYMMPFLLNKKTLEKNDFPFDYPFKKPVEYREGMCPNAERILPRMTLMPVSPIMTDKEADEVIEAVVKVYRGLELV